MCFLLTKTISITINSNALDQAENRATIYDYVKGDNVYLQPYW